VIFLGSRRSCLARRSRRLVLSGVMAMTRWGEEGIGYQPGGRAPLETLNRPSKNLLSSSVKEVTPAGDPMREAIASRRSSQFGWVTEEALASGASRYLRLIPASDLSNVVNLKVSNHSASCVSATSLISASLVR
jgi:hypothetical protein